MFHRQEDTKFKEVKDILPSSGSCQYSEKSEWFVLGTEDRLRKVLAQIINKDLAR